MKGPWAWGLILGAALAGCVRTQDRPVTTWFKVEVTTPVRLAHGHIPLVPPTLERYQALMDGRWRFVAKGRRGQVMRLADDRAVLFTPSSGSNAWILYQGQTVARALQDVIPCAGNIVVSPPGDRLDCLHCSERSA